MGHKHKHKYNSSYNDQQSSSSSSGIVIAAIIIALGFVGGGYLFSYPFLTEKDIDQKIEAAVEAYFEKNDVKPADSANNNNANANKNTNSNTKVVEVSVDDDPVIGDENAPVTVVEFSDYECPYCKKNYENVYKKVKEKYIDTGKVKWVFRDFPLRFHKQAIPAALAAECAHDQDKYFEMHALLFKNQRALLDDDLIGYAKEIGLDMTEFESCFDSQKHNDEINKDKSEGSSYGVSGTPALFINGKYHKGAQSYSKIEASIEEALNN